MRSQIKKLGNSASIRIPATVLSAASMRIDQHVEIREEEGRIVIEPVSAPHYDLDALLDRMTPDTITDKVDFGAPVGAEVW